VSDSEVLTACIERAVAGDWKPHYIAEPVDVDISLHDYTRRIRFGSLLDGVTMAVEEIIFDHAFAKCLWGEEEQSDKCKCGKPAGESHSASFAVHGPTFDNLGWQHHLKQMVIAPDRVEYLRQWLGEQE
jgi:hypothetical protein